jgi:hypothetical protein
LSLHGAHHIYDSFFDLWLLIINGQAHLSIWQMQI